MCYQECALYGDLVLFLRDRAAELLSGDDGDAEAERERLDAIIRDWFFEPQDRLHGCAPRDLIWAEQKGEPNPIPPDRLEEFFFDDCPVCQFTRQELEEAIESGEDPGFHWHYDDGGYPLIAHYDPEGWDEHWDEWEAAIVEEEEERAPREEEEAYPPAAPAYEPPPVEAPQLSPEEFAAQMRQPWLDPALHQAARTLTERVDCPEPGPFGQRYRRLTHDEALSLAAGLHGQGVDVEELLAQVEAFPYQNVALDWLSDPEMNVATIIRAMEEEIPPDDDEGRARFRHHRDFILALSEVIHPGARLWLQGWLDAVAHGAFTRADESDDEETNDVF